MGECAMKRVGYLADKVFTMENAHLAWDTYNRKRPKKLRRKFDENLAQ